MSDTARRLRRLFAAILGGATLIGVGIGVDRWVLGATGRAAPEQGSQAEAAEEEEHSSDDPEHGDPDDEHTEEDTAFGTAGVASRIELSETILDNIGLTTQIISLGPVEQTILFPGTVRMHPDGIAVLSARIQGKIVSVNAAPGDRVRKDQVLVRIQSLVPGNPPPTVSVVAPISGIVSRRDAVVGQVVQPNRELFQLIDPRQVVMEARVPERIVDRIRLGQEALVHRLRSHERSIGRVSFIGSETDPVTRTYAVWIELLGQARPRPGQFVDIQVIESRKTALTVPQQAIVEEGPLQFVFVRRGEAFERRLVRTGVEDEENIEILSGATAGDTVAVVGSYELLLALQTIGPGGVPDESAPHEH